MLRHALDLLTPDVCLLCDAIQRPRPHHLLCEWCLQALPHNTVSCPLCALPGAVAGPCAECTRHAPISSRTVAPLMHRAEARYLVHRLKYNRDLRAGRVLAYLMRVAMTCAYAGDVRPRLLVPVPISRRRMLTRGFNQAGWLAADISAYTATELVHHGIRRAHGPPQSSLNKTRRKALPASTFTLSRQAQQQVRRQHVAIVDDVLTTGATAMALAAALLSAGAERIDIWSATRAVMDEPW